MRRHLIIALALAGTAWAQERRLAESEVRAALREAARRALGPEIEIGLVHYRGDLVVRGAGAEFEVGRPATVRSPGRVALVATLRTSLEQRSIAFYAEVAAAAAPGVRRGASVLLLARSGLVTVTAGGQAQQDGGLGDRIHVLCPALRRVLVGRVVDASTVEIDIGGSP